MSVTINCLDVNSDSDSVVVCSISNGKTKNACQIALVTRVKLDYVAADFHHNLCNNLLSLVAEECCIYLQHTERGRKNCCCCTSTIWCFFMMLFSCSLLPSDLLDCLIYFALIFWEAIERALPKFLDSLS